MDRGRDGGILLNFPISDNPVPFISRCSRCDDKIAKPRLRGTFVHRATSSERHAILESRRRVTALLPLLLPLGLLFLYYVQELWTLCPSEEQRGKLATRKALLGEPHFLLKYHSPCRANSLACRVREISDTHLSQLSTLLLCIGEGGEGIQMMVESCGQSRAQ